MSHSLINIMYYVYILYSEKLDRYYVGSSQNIEVRLHRHNAGHSTYTKKGIPWILLYSEKLENRSLAYNREMEIKGKKSKKYIERLIASVG